MKTKIYLFILSFFTLVPCKASRTSRMYDSVEHAIESHNNGDSTELIVVIVGGIILGILWLIWKNNKNK